MNEKSKNIKNNNLTSMISLIAAALLIVAGCLTMFLNNEDKDEENKKTPEQTQSVENNDKLMNEMIGIIDGNTTCYGSGILTDLYNGEGQINDYDSYVKMKLLRDYLTKNEVVLNDASEELFNCSAAPLGCEEFPKDIYEKFLKLYNINELEIQGLTDNSAVLTKHGYGGLCTGKFESHNYTMNKLSEDEYTLIDNFVLNDENNEKVTGTLQYTFKVIDNEVTLYSTQKNIEK